uniref:Uncharacterized protein LOC114329942 n=1 Tax=Diabrotica virgifera virgifera TaxID=50390 RepID=A0A6P7FPZ8_DIAVI
MEVKQEVSDDNETCQAERYYNAVEEGPLDIYKIEIKEEPKRESILSDTFDCEAPKKIIIKTKTEQEEHKCTSVKGQTNLDKQAGGALDHCSRPIGDALLDLTDVLRSDCDQYGGEAVRILYVSNIPAETSSGNLKRVIISRIDALADHITRVFRKRRYAFVHFDDRFSAESALELLQESDITIKGQRITFEWARPQCYSKSNILNSTPTNFCTSVSIQRRKKVFAMKTEKKKFGSFSSGPTSSSSTPNSNTPNSSTPNSNTPNNSTPNSSEASSSPRSVYSNEENWY